MNTSLHRRHVRAGHLALAGVALTITIAPGLAAAASASSPTRTTAHSSAQHSSAPPSSAPPSSTQASSTQASSTQASSATASGGATPSPVLGKTLFDANCSSCHGIDAQGSALGPNLRGLGAATIDLWVSSGWMPLANSSAQPARKPSLFDRTQTIAIAHYVAGLAPGGLAIPAVDLRGASVSEGFSIFALNCAPCHTITGAGDALSNGLFAPPLHGVTATQVAEAVRSGPGNMPRFGPGVISNAQLRSLISYVTTYIEHPRNPGGLGLGGIGPVAEGFIGLFIGVGLCLVVALWIGDRTEDEELEPSHDVDGSEGTGAGVVHA